MTDLFDNPMGLDRLRVRRVRLARRRTCWSRVFEALGFTLVARHRSKDVPL